MTENRTQTSLLVETIILSSLCSYEPHTLLCRIHTCERCLTLLL